MSTGNRQRVAVSRVNKVTSWLDPTMSFTNNTTNVTWSSTNDSLTNQSVLEPNYAKVLRLCFSSLICFSGIVGNLMVCFITFFNRKSSAVNYYILNLAIADLGTLAICYPLTLVKSADPNEWPLGKFVCQVLYPLSDIFYGASIASIVAIALDRYQALVHSMRRNKTLQVVKWVLLFVWLSAFLLIVLPLYFVMSYIEVKSKGYVDCTPIWPSNILFQLYVTSLTLFWYAIPLCIILLAYRKIAQKIKDSKALHKNMRKQCSSQYKKTSTKNQEESSSSSLTKPSPKHRKREDQNTKALKILVPIVVTFAVLMLPFHVFRLSQAFVPDLFQVLPYPWLIYNLCTVLLLANSSANPIIYSLVSDEFRKRFKNLLFLRW